MNPRHIAIYPADGTWVVRAGGAVIGESARALELQEGDYPAVIYFPREDVGAAFLEPSGTRTTCPYKGEATHFGISVEGGVIADAAWSYETPTEAMTPIRGHLAFYTDKVTVERL